MKKFLVTLITIVAVLAIATVSLADSVGAAAYQTSAGESEEYFAYNGTVTAGKMEAGTHCGAGETLFYNENGVAGQGTGLTFSANAEMKGVEATGSYRAGTENYNTHGSATYSAGEARATAATTLGYGENGLQANAVVGAEVNAMELKGSVGATVAGVEVNASASVKVGVGAKANVGYSNGILKIEVGAALGIGGTVGVDVNVGQIANKVTEGAKKAWSWVKSWF